MLARQQTVKLMWRYIKENDLADPSDRKFTICNAELMKVFGVKRFYTFGMLKYLKNHFVE